MDRVGPSSVTGGSVAFTRLPSARRASTIGDVSSIRRPTRAAIRWMIRTRCSVSRKRTAVSFELSEPLDIDLVKAVDQDVGDRGIGHQRGQRADAQRLLEQILSQAAPLVLVERDVFGVEDALHKGPDFGLQLRLIGSQQASLVNFIQQPLVQLPLHREVFGLADARGRSLSCVPARRGRR